MFSGAASTSARMPSGVWRVLVPALFLGALLPAQLLDPSLVGSLLHRLPHPGEGFDLPSGRQLYESAQLTAGPLGAAAFVQAAALAVTFSGILMLALLA